jgi:hypothetical protein
MLCEESVFYGIRFTIADVPVVHLHDVGNTDIGVILTYQV